MAINKVIYNTANGEEVLMDLTTDTVTPETLAEGVTAHDASGERIEGTMKTGGAPVHVEEKDVNFWDYDGTLLHSYTLAEAQAMTELPPLPTREGLICQGWNWTLEQIKSFGLQVEVGAVYITDDGKTRIKIDVSSMLISNVTLNFGGAVVNIDWGDGSEIEVSSGTGTKQHTHQYSATGIYTIALEVISGTLRLGGNNATLPLIGSNAYDATRCIIEVNCGSNIAATLGANSLNTERRLKAITIPEGVTSIASTIFSATNALISLILPKTITKTETIATTVAMRVLSLPWGITDLGAVNGPQSLTRFVLPPNLTILRNQVGYNAQMTVLHLPESLTTIGTRCFYNQKQLSEIYAHAATPPAIGDANMFSNSPDYQKIYVPAGSLEAYQTATNWTAYADRMEEWNP